MGVLVTGLGRVVHVAMTVIVIVGMVVRVRMTVVVGVVVRRRVVLPRE